jgi:hypothetical protein
MYSLLDGPEQNKHMSVKAQRIEEEEEEEEEEERKRERKKERKRKYYLYCSNHVYFV